MQFIAYFRFNHIVLIPKEFFYYLYIYIYYFIILDFFQYNMLLNMNNYLMNIQKIKITFLIKSLSSLLNILFI